MEQVTGSGGAQLGILTVCSHNRTRSVMSMAMLQAGFDQHLGPGTVAVASLGFGPEDLPAIPDAIDAMRRRGLDVSDHRSRKVTRDRLAGSSLILTSEKDHVIRLAGEEPSAFARTFTLPEFCGRLRGDPEADGRSLDEWIAALSSDRTPMDYLSDDVPEVADPTGTSRRNFEAATVGIEEMCAQVVSAVVRAMQLDAETFEF